MDGLKFLYNHIYKPLVRLIISLVKAVVPHLISILKALWHLLLEVVLVIYRFIAPYLGETVPTKILASVGLLTIIALVAFFAHGII